METTIIAGVTTKVIAAYEVVKTFTTVYECIEAALNNFNAKYPDYTLEEEIDFLLGSFNEPNKKDFDKITYRYKCYFNSIIKPDLVIDIYNNRNLDLTVKFYID